MICIGDMDDKDYIAEQCEELKTQILIRNGKLVKEFNKEIEHLLDAPHAMSAPEAPAKPAISSPVPIQRHFSSMPNDETVPLDSLTIDDVGTMLEALNMGQYKKALKEQSIDGPCLGNTTITINIIYSSNFINNC